MSLCQISLVVFIFSFPYFKWWSNQLIWNYQGGLSDGYKTYIAEKGIPDETYKEDGVALFRVQGTGPDNMQAIQVEAVRLLSLSLSRLTWLYLLDISGVFTFFSVYAPVFMLKWFYISLCFIESGCIIFEFFLLLYFA